MGIKDKDQPKSIPGISLGINIAVGMVLFTLLKQPVLLFLRKTAKDFRHAK